ncbi:MAG: MFS transporter [Acidobacteria bacterium]|nr:MFS transporter [Acidobacteriota bacterium]
MRENPPGPSVEPHPRRWLILAVLCSSMVMVFTNLGSMNIALPTMQTALGASGSDLQWITDAQILTFACLLLPLGALGDRRGRKGVLLAGIVIFGAASGLAAYATTAGQVIVYRAVMGVGAALVMPATLSIGAALFPPSDRAKAVAAWSAAAGLSGMLGPVVGGVLLRHFWWGSAFLFTVPVAGAVVVLAAWLVPTSRDEEQRPLDAVGSALSIVALGCLLFGIIEGPELGWRDPWVIGGFGAAAVGLWAYARWGRRVRYPMLDPAYFGNRVFTLGAVSAVATFCALYGTVFILTQFFQFAQGHSPLAAGVRMLPVSAVVFLIAPRIPALIARSGTRSSLSAGLLISTAGMAIMGTVRTLSPYWLAAVGLSVLGVGLAVTMPTAAHAIVSSLPPHKSGVGSALNDTTRETGGAVGIALLGSLLSVGYRQGVSGRLGDLPAATAEAASDSIGGAVGAGADLPAAAAERLLVVAADAFDRGAALAAWAAAALLLFTAVIVHRTYPKNRAASGHATPAGVGAGSLRGQPTAPSGEIIHFVPPAVLPAEADATTRDT